MSSDNLFGPNVHSQYRVIWKKTDSQTRELLLKLIKKNFSTQEVFDICKIDEWEKMSNNFRITFRNSKQYPYVLLRKNILHKTENTLYLIHDIESELSRLAIPIPRVIPTKQGKIFFSSSGSLWQFFEYIEGSHYHGSKPELIDCAKSVALLHLAFRKVKLHIPTINTFSPDLNEWNSLLSRQNPSDPFVNRILKKNYKFILEQIRLVKSLEEKSCDFRIQLIHRDLHPHNVLYKNGHLVAFFDFGDVTSGQLIRDIGNACHRFVRQYVLYSQKPWKTALTSGIRSFLEAYQSISSLPGNEVALMPLFITDELLRKMYYILDKYYNGDSTYIENGSLEKFINLLKEAFIINKYLKKYENISFHT